MNLLLVDDRLIEFQVLELLFLAHDFGGKVQHAATADDALATLADEPTDAVLIDWFGVERQDELIELAQSRGIPVAIYTANGDQTAHDCAKRYGIPIIHKRSNNEPILSWLTALQRDARP